jgi:hypothetical protein
MKNINLITALLCMVAFTLQAQTTPKSEEQQIQKTLVNLFEGFSAFDVNQTPEKDRSGKSQKLQTGEYPYVYSNPGAGKSRLDDLS